MLSHPDWVINVIRAAAKAAQGPRRQHNVGSEMLVSVAVQ
jgi:hypothetical protein